MPIKRASRKAKSDDGFGQARKPVKMLRAGVYARVSTTDQTLAMQNRAMREYAARRGLDSRLRACSRSSEQEGKKGEVNELQAGIEFAFAVFPEPAALFQPSEGSFDDPALGQHSKCMQFIALDDLDRCLQALHHPISEGLPGVYLLPRAH